MGHNVHIRQNCSPLNVPCKAFLRRAALSNGGVCKRSYFEAKCVNISKTVGFESKVTINDLTGSCICAFGWH